MDVRQMYNNSAMLHDAFRSRANEVSDTSDKQLYDQLANDQRTITDRLRQKMDNGVQNNTTAQQSGNVTPNQVSPDSPDSPKQ